MGSFTNPEDILDTSIIDHYDGDECFAEMAAVGGGFNSIRLAIRGSEGMIPHFHFYKGIGPNQGIADNRVGGGCICFDRPQYFANNSHNDRITNKEMRGLHEFLLTKRQTGIINWCHMIEL